MNIEDYFVDCLNNKGDVVFIAVKNDIAYLIYMMQPKDSVSNIIDLYRQEFYKRLYNNLKNREPYGITFSGLHDISCRICVINETSINFKQFEDKVVFLKKKIRLEKIDKLLS